MKRTHSQISQSQDEGSFYGARRDPVKKYSRGRYAPLRKNALAKTVRTIIQQQAEKKRVQFTQEDKLLYAYNSASWAASIFPVTPYGASLTLNQGVGDGSRVGNRVKLSKLRFRGMIVPTGYNATTNPNPVPVAVKMWLLYDKENPNTISPPGSDFLQNGNSSGPLQATITDSFASVNSDRWVVKAEKIFKLGFSAYGGTGTQPAFQSTTNNDFKLMHEFDMDLLPLVSKTVVYDDNTSIPETRGLFCVMEVLNIFGSTLPVAAALAEMHYQLTMEYTDV